MLRELEAEGQLAKRRKTYRDPDKLPPVTVLQVLAPDADGDLFAKPLEWHGEGPEPRVLLVARESDPALGEGDRILARLTEMRGRRHTLRGAADPPHRHQPAQASSASSASPPRAGASCPSTRASDREWPSPPGATHGAKDGELVEAEQAGPKGRLGLPKARIVDAAGRSVGARAPSSLIAIHQHGIPDDFPDEVIAEADAREARGPQGPRGPARPAARHHRPGRRPRPRRRRLGHADDDPKNPGGLVVWVAIADVAHYVTPGSALDREARKRGNSTYFPDRVVPMLPDRLSGDLCSLHEGVPRACIAVADADRRGAATRSATASCAG